MHIIRPKCKETDGCFFDIVGNFGEKALVICTIITVIKTIREFKMELKQRIVKHGKYFITSMREAKKVLDSESETNIVVVSAVGPAHKTNLKNKNTLENQSRINKAG